MIKTKRYWDKVYRTQRDLKSILPGFEISRPSYLGIDYLRKQTEFTRGLLLEHKNRKTFKIIVGKSNDLEALHSLSGSTKHIFLFEEKLHNSFLFAGSGKYHLTDAQIMTIINSAYKHSKRNVWDGYGI